MNEYSIWTARGFPMDAGTLAGLFKYHADQRRARAATSTIDPVRDAHTTPGDVFAPVRADRDDRAARRRLQERARLVQRDRERDDAAARQPDLHAGARRTCRLAPPNGLDVHGRRLLPAGDAHHDAGGQHTWVDVDFAGEHPHRTALDGRPDRPGDDRRSPAASARRPNTRRRELNDKIAVGHALGHDADLPVGRGSRSRTTSRSRTCRPARRAGRAATRGDDQRRRLQRLRLLRHAA